MTMWWSYDAVAMYPPSGEKTTRTTNLEDLKVWTGWTVMRSVRTVLGCPQLDPRPPLTSRPWTR